MNINSYGDVAKLNIATSPYDIPKRKSVASVHATLFLFEIGRASCRERV